MLIIADPGCSKHDASQLIMSGSEAELIKNILYNLPKEGGFHTFICEHGYTHHVNFEFKIDMVSQVSNKNEIFYSINQ